MILRTRWALWLCRRLASLRGDLAALNRFLVSLHRFAQAGGQRLDQAIGEQRHLPQRRRRAGRAFQPHHHVDRDADQPPGGVEQQEGERELGEHRGQDAPRDVRGAEVEHDVEPRIADQQRPGDDHEDDDQLALLPRGPDRRYEAEQLAGVQAYPDGAPVVDLEGHRQVDRQDPDPGPQRRTDPDQNQQPQLPSAAELRVQPRMREVDGGQGTSQLLPLLGRHPPERSLIDHVSHCALGPLNGLKRGLVS
jgi:hypothetical protein